MTIKKQTAVEWLVEKYELVGMLTPPMIERAKAMEKEQTMEFALRFLMQDRPVVSFYNETYGGDK
jgi:hypothetical protein